MVEFFTELNEDIKTFIKEQKIFFTATAPVEGRVNLSPKGMDTLRILDDYRIMYLDLTGSGNETAAHLKENGRMTMMMCSFAGRPLILRLYGMGYVVSKRDERWIDLYKYFEPIEGARQIIVLELESLQTSCGYSIPLYDFNAERNQLVRWAQNKGLEGIKAYQSQKNAISIDGLPTGIETE